MAKIKQVPGQLPKWDSQQRMGEPAPKLEEEGSVSCRRRGGFGDKQRRVRRSEIAWVTGLTQPAEQRLSLRLTHPYPGFRDPTPEQKGYSY